MTDTVDVAIVGAGPYGLSIASHLAKLKIEHVIVGNPMGYWRSHMPSGMLLKSEGEASSLYDPERIFSLERFCGEQGIQYAPLGVPVALDTFIAYGLAFQKKYAPTTESRKVFTIEQSAGRFRLAYQDGGILSARIVIVATGLTYYNHIPEELAALPRTFVTHSSEHSTLDHFRNTRVAVIGAGASAVDIATLLHEGGASVHLISRKLRIDMPEKMRLPRTLLDRIKLPVSGIGPSWRSLFYAEAPHLFHALPTSIRLGRVKNHLGPAGGYFMRQRVDRVFQLFGYRPKRVETVNTTIRLTLESQNGTESCIDTDHIIAATGFRVDLRRLTFLEPKLRSKIESVEHTPVLSSHFQSSIPGLYFVGPAAANSFGPVMRFAFGAKFAAPHVSKSLARIFRSKFVGRHEQEKM